MSKNKDININDLLVPISLITNSSISSNSTASNIILSETKSSIMYPSKPKNNKNRKNNIKHRHETTFTSINGNDFDETIPIPIENTIDKADANFNMMNKSIINTNMTMKSITERNLTNSNTILKTNRNESIRINDMIDKQLAATSTIINPLDPSTKHKLTISKIYIINEGINIINQCIYLSI